MQVTAAKPSLIALTLRDMAVGSWLRKTFAFIAAVLIWLGAIVLHTTVLPDEPKLAFFESLSVGTIATLILAWLGRGPF